MTFQLFGVSLSGYKGSINHATLNLIQVCNKEIRLGTNLPFGMDCTL